MTDPNIIEGAALDALLASIGNVVDGQTVRGGETFDVVNPATGEVFAQAPKADAELLDRAVAAARRAQPAWAADIEARRVALRAMVELIPQVFPETNTLSILEKGDKTSGYHLFVADMYGKYYAEYQLPVDVVHDDDEKTISVVREPVGVVAVITPWNAPLLILCAPVFAALLLGNTVVVKPSPFTPLGSLRLVERWQQVLPAGVLNIVAGDDELGAQLVSHADVDFVAFTGSVRAGRSIAAAAGAQLKGLSAELGGNDAAIVLDDVDPALVAPLLFRAMYVLSGQACAAIKRLLVHESVYDRLVEQLVQLCEQTEAGSSGMFAPLNTKPQFDRVCELVDDAAEHGGKVLCGGAPTGEGYFYPPTIVTGAGPGVRLYDEEQFGPVVPVLPFSDVEEAVRLANDTEFGLSASVWGVDLVAADAVAARLRAGTVFVNNHAEVAPYVPFGGMKSSGLGRTGGEIGIDHFAELKTVIRYKDAARVG